MKKILLTTAALVCVSMPVFAANPHAGHHMAASYSKPSVAKNAAVKAYVAAMDKMHRQMDIKYSGNADVDFARGMIPHHQGAVDMVAVLLKHSKNQELRELAEFMKTWQNQEIGIMKRWLSARDTGPKDLCDCDAETTKKYREAMDKMHRDMAIKYTGNVDVDFVNGMIPHHQGAIDMAWILIEHGVDPELRKIARDVIRSQEQEIAFMKEWLEKHKGKK